MQETIKSKPKKVSKPKEYGVDCVMVNLRISVEEKKQMQQMANKEFRSLTSFIKSRCLASK